MIFLIFSFLFLAPTQCNVIKESEAYQSLEDPYEFTSPYELIDMGIDNLCSTYPSLRLSSDEEMSTFKKEYLMFLAEKSEVQDEVLHGFPTNYRVLWGRMKELRRIATEEFEELSEEEKHFIESPTGLLLHKLGIQSALRVIESRWADFKKRKLTKEQIKEEVEDRQLEIIQSWYGDDIEDDEESAEGREFVDEL